MGVFADFGTAFFGKVSKKVGGGGDRIIVKNLNLWAFQLGCKRNCRFLKDNRTREV